MSDVHDKAAARPVRRRVIGAGGPVTPTTPTPALPVPVGPASPAPAAAARPTAPAASARSAAPAAGSARAATPAPGAHPAGPALKAEVITGPSGLDRARDDEDDDEALEDEADEDEDFDEDDDGDLDLESLRRERIPQSSVRGDDLLRVDGFTRYLAEIRNYPLLTREEEARFGEAYFNQGDVQAGRKLVTGNLRLVVKIAMEYRRAWVNVMDLIQEGNIGLAEAVKRFDPYRGVRFSSFARYWIRALILQFILKNFRMVSFASTRAGRKLFFRLEKERHKLMQEFGEASTKMLAERLDVSEEDVENATRLRQAPLSLNAPRGSEDDGRTLGEALPTGQDVEQEVVQSTLLDSVDGYMRAFAETLDDPRDQAIWTERLVAEEPVPLAVLGDRFGVSRERIRQIEARLKKRLKAYLVEHFGDALELDFAQD